MPALADVAAAARRFRCTPAEAAALALLALGALGAVALLWFLARPMPAAPGELAEPTEASTAGDGSGLAVSAVDVVVHVAGEVRQPGVYTLPGGSRVADALEAASGPRRRAVLDGLNLARVLVDGEQVLVPSRADLRDLDPGGASGTTSPGSAPSRVSLNQATPADLETLPNIGPVLAQRIIDHRDSIGGFTEIGQLRDVPGIGEKTFQALVDHVTL